MGKRNHLDVRVDEQLQFSVSKKVDTKLEFFEDQLTAKLDKKLLKRIVNKKIEIDDLEGLVKFLKSYGVSPKEFKQYIKSSKEIDMDEIDRLVEIGDIQIEDLQGCYKVEFDEEIRVKKTK